MLDGHTFPASWTSGECAVRLNTSGTLTMTNFTGAFTGDANDCDSANGRGGVTGTGVVTWGSRIPRPSGLRRLPRDLLRGQTPSSTSANFPLWGLTLTSYNGAGVACRTRLPEIPASSPRKTVGRIDAARSPCVVSWCLVSRHRSRE